MTGSSDRRPAGEPAATHSALVETETGLARVLLARAARPRLLLVLGHGAGGGVEAPDLRALADALPGRGVSVARVESPWRVAGRRIAPSPARLDIGWRAVLAALRAAGEFDLPVVLGGRSAGARVACRAAGTPAPWLAGVLALAFPLHPPGRSERSRADELAGVVAAGAPLLVVQGDRDPFGRPAEFPAEVRLAPIEAADHGFGVARSSGSTQDRALADVVAVAGEWLTGLA